MAAARLARGAAGRAGRGGVGGPRGAGAHRVARHQVQRRRLDRRRVVVGREVDVERVLGDAVREHRPRRGGRGERRHTGVTAPTCWQGAGGENTPLWRTLIDGRGLARAEWDLALADSPGGVTIDSVEICARFGFEDFTGQLFIHAIGAIGHDIVKYALDTYGNDPRDLSCTHDANAWPADFYGGLPAPRDHERVLLWIQNSHPCPIPAGIVGLNLMGDDKTAWLDHEIPAFATYAADAADLLPDAAWPAQSEIHAGQHFVRPRYDRQRGV